MLVHTIQHPRDGPSISRMYFLRHSHPDHPKQAPQRELSTFVVKPRVREYVLYRTYIWPLKPLENKAVAVICVLYKSSRTRLITRGARIRTHHWPIESMQPSTPPPPPNYGALAFNRRYMTCDAIDSTHHLLVPEPGPHALSRSLKRGARGVEMFAGILFHQFFCVETLSRQSWSISVGRALYDSSARGWRFPLRSVGVVEWWVGMLSMSQNFLQNVYTWVSFHCRVIVLYVIKPAPVLLIIIERFVG